jgi:hypothetical protein
MTRKNKFNMETRPIFKSSTFFTAVAAGAVLLLCGCIDAKKVAELHARIEALEKRQEEDGIKLAGMNEKIVTKAIDVQGLIKSESLVVKNVIKSGLIDVGDLQASVSISGSGIVISSLDHARKKGAISRYDSESFKIDNYSSNRGFPTTKGSGVVFSVGSVAGEPEFKMWSFAEESSKSFWRRDFKTESILSSEAVLANANGSATFVGAKPNFMFAARLISLSEDGIVRFELANLSAVSATTVRGTIETVVGLEGKKTVSFVIDQPMSTGRFLSVAVDVGAKKNDVTFMTLKNLHVDAFTH